MKHIKNWEFFTEADFMNQNVFDYTDAEGIGTEYKKDEEVLPAEACS